MGRKRSDKNRWMPPYVKTHKGRYVYVPYLGKGQRGQEIVLGKVDQMTRGEVWQRYEEVAGVRGNLNLCKLLDQFMLSPDFLSLAPRTQRDYGRYYDIITDKSTGSGVFGDVYIEQVTIGVIQRYLDKRADEGAPVAGNKEVGFLSAAFSWARRRELVKDNPCIGVKKNPKGRRQHVPTEQEYQTALALASPAYLPLLMELAYLCRLRKNEVLILDRSRIEEKGLRVYRGKGSKGGLILWSPRLRKVVDDCLAMPLKIHPIDPAKVPLIHDKSGSPLTIGAIDSAWRRLNSKMKAAGHKPFWIHDLKRKAVSDFEGDKLKASGHRDPKMLEIYDVSEDEVVATR